MKRVFSAIIVFALAVAACAGLSGCNPSYQKRTEFVFSDSGLTLSVMGTGGKFDKAFEEMLAVLRVIEKETNVNIESGSVAVSGYIASDMTGYAGSTKKEYNAERTNSAGESFAGNEITNSAAGEGFADKERINSAEDESSVGDQGVLRINRATAGERVEIGFYTFDMIRLAKQAYQKTGGAFNIAAYPLVYLWSIDALGYEDSVQDYMRGLPFDEWRTPYSFADSDIKRTLPVPDYDEAQRVKKLCDLDRLEIFEDEGRYFAEKDLGALMIDLGGISKGYAADLCAEIALSHGLDSALIEISGNIVLVGDYVEDGKKSDWRIGITNPNGGIFCAYSAKANTTAVTSGDYERFRRATSGGNNIEICHIINSASGLPYGLEFDGAGYRAVADRVVSVSVLSGSSALADAYTTAACVMGFDRAVEFFVENSIDAIIITADKRLSITEGVQLVLTEKYNAFADYARV